MKDCIDKPVIQLLATAIACGDRAISILDQVGMAPAAARPCRELAYGDVKRVELAIALASDPQLLLMDEPTAGMGHEDIDRISALIKSVSAERTVLMVEHNLSVVASLSDRITVLTRGRVLAEGDYETVSADPNVRDADDVRISLDIGNPDRTTAVDRSHPGREIHSFFSVPYNRRQPPP